MSETGKQWAGQVVDGKFELREYLGGADCNSVFLTEREGKKAAIKLIAADASRADLQLSRWEQAGNLTHPHLIRLFESGRCRLGTADLIYVVMEYAEENLAEILPQRALTLTEVGEMLPPVLDALAYLHGRGLVHGHIKPSNVLASGDQVKISSDGICRVGEARSQPSAYDAPEVATGGCSAAGDVWSLGMTLVETLTQQLPRRKPNGTDEAVLPGPLPEPFLSIARNCLQRDPQRRWTVADIPARLRPSASVPQVQVTARPPAKPQKAPAATWRHMVPAAVLILLALVVILVAPKVLNRLQGQPSGAAVVEPATQPASHERSAAKPEEPTPAKAPRANSAAPPITPVEAAPPPKKAMAPGDVLHQVVPDVPQKARETIQGTVKVGVRVEVGPSGDVTDASLDSPGPSKYFANLAAKAAHEWKFTPAADSEGGVREWILRFQFTQDGTKVIPVRAAPTN